MPKGKFDYYDVPGWVVGTGETPGEYRVESTGRGKSTNERWQRRVIKPLFLDGVFANEVVDAILTASAGLEHAYINNEAKSDGYDGLWVTTNLSGWVDVVSGIKEVVHANDEIVAVKRHVTAQYEAANDEAMKRRAAASAELQRIARAYPDLIEELGLESDG